MPIVMHKAHIYSNFVYFLPPIKTDTNITLRIFDDFIKVCIGKLIYFKAERLLNKESKFKRLNLILSCPTNNSSLLFSFPLIIITARI